MKKVVPFIKVQTVVNTSFLLMVKEYIELGHGNDPAVGTDAKGRTIYQGPQGGKYVLNNDNRRDYIETKSNKVLNKI